MKFETAFNCGDLAWVWNGNGVQQLTVGQIRITYTSSVGDPLSMFSNYRPQEGFEECYMCEESGIGSGNVYTLGKHIFLTKEACEKANAENIAQLAKERAEHAASLKRHDEQRLIALRRELAALEKASA